MSQIPTLKNTTILLSTRGRELGNFRELASNSLMFRRASSRLRELLAKSWEYASFWRVEFPAFGNSWQLGTKKYVFLWWKKINFGNMRKKYFFLWWKKINFETGDQAFLSKSTKKSCQGRELKNL